MVSRTLPAILSNSSYICETCLHTSRYLCRAKAGPLRLFSNASSVYYQTPRQISPTLEKKCRLKAAKGGYRNTSNLYVPLRLYSTEASSQQAITSGIAPLPHRRLISLSGPDAAKFLHGLITNTADATQIAPFYSAFLDARGRLLWDVFVWVWPELIAENSHWACYIEVDAEEADSLKKHLKKHKLRSKITIKDVPNEGSEGIRVWAAWGSAHQNVQQGSEITRMADPRFPGMYRYLVNADCESISETLQVVDTRYYHIHRYLSGVPEGQQEMPRETALPMECNIDLSGGIDFKKGCYVGQELTIRTKHTGVVRKRILPVQFNVENPRSTSANTMEPPRFNNSFSPQPLPGADIKVLDDAGAVKKGRAVGKIVAAIGNVGLASCRLENMTSMRVSAEGGTYKPGMQFGVDVDGEVVRVEPVLYGWFVQRKEALWNREEKKRIREHDTKELD